MVATDTVPTTDARAEPPSQRSRALGAHLFAIYALLLLEDAARKVFGWSDAVLVAKELLIGSVYVSYLPRVLRRVRPIPPVTFFLGGGVALWLLAEASTPYATFGSLVLGLFAYLWHAPLAYVAAWYFADQTRLVRAVRVVAVAGVLVALGAVVSIGAPGSAPPILQPLTEEAGIRSYENEELFLAPSVFATGEKAADHLLFAATACFLLALTANGRRRRLGSLVLLAVVLAGSVATQRRAALGLTVAALLLLGLATAQVVLATNRRRVRPRRVALIIIPAVVYVAVTAIGGDMFLRFVSDRRGYDNVASTIGAVGELPFTLDGQGTGTATQGIDRFGLPTDRGTEGTLSKVWLELGLLGVALYYSFLLAWLAPLLSRFRQLDVYGRGSAIAATAVFALGFKAHQIWDNPQVQIMFWLAVGAAWGTLRRVLRTKRAGAPSVALGFPSHVRS